MRILATALAACALATACMAETYTWRETLDAIRVVETGGCKNGGIGAKGDGGRAAGPYQIHRVYHTDAAERDKSLTSYGSCLTSKTYSERVVRAYMNRYSREALRRLEAGKGTLADVERVSRIHNGGPQGYRKKTTLGYWAKVKKEVTR
jgi:delta 1-pyrroline-5-carboxylate dehydrogenase